MPKLVWLNGKTMPLESAVTDVADHAHLYGDGIFEGIRIYDRKVFKLDEHLRRLIHGATYLAFEHCPTFEYVRDVVLETCRAADMDAGYIRVNLTRGTGLGLDPAHIVQKPNLMVMISQLRLFPEEVMARGLNAVTASVRVAVDSGLDPRLKCIGNYATNIMAKLEANRKGAGEALMLNTEGVIAEGTGDNFFLIRDSVIYTPHPSCGILRGITRDTVMEIAEGLGYKVVEDFLTPFDVFTADEAFFTGTAAEIVACISLDGRPVGKSEPGPITRRLIEAFHRETAKGTPFAEKEVVQGAA